MGKQKKGRKFRPPLLGCIADDFTGATDLAGILVLNGMRATVAFGMPECNVANADAIVIALKSRSAPVNNAIESSRAALRWLLKEGCRQFFFKYCSTFDSTPDGNIGPVIEALMDELNAKFTIACPAFPANGRTIYNGYLFVGDVLLEESSMRFHPLTPMMDSNLVRLLQAQSTRKVGLIRYPTVLRGVSSIENALSDARANGISLAIVDAVSESDLRNITAACPEFPLWTGASGLAMGIPDVFRSRGLLRSDIDAGLMPHIPGLSVVISGSCSETTQRQVAWMEKQMPTLHLDPLSAAMDPELVTKAVQWAHSQMRHGPVLISATADAKTVTVVQEKLGSAHAGQLVESLLADIARRLVDHGVRRMIVAGGETSGAVLKALDVHNLRIGPQIDPGVHWAVTEGNRPLALALKSGNFGSEDFFTKAWSILQ